MQVEMARQGECQGHVNAGGNFEMPTARGRYRRDRIFERIGVQFYPITNATEIRDIESAVWNHRRGDFYVGRGIGGGQRIGPGRESRQYC